MSGSNPAAQPGKAGSGDPAPQPKKRSVPVQQAFKAALDLYNQGKHAAALNICAQIVKARPKHADAHNLLGVILHAQGKSAEAVKALQKAINLNDKSSQYYSNLGEIERKRGKQGQALVALRRAVALNPNSAQALNNLGIVYFDRKDYEEAVSCYNKAIACNDTYPEAYNNLGNALRALHRPDEALKAYQHALLLREDYPEAYNNLATVLGDEDQFEEAEHAYRRAISLRPRYLEAYNNLAAMLVSRDRFDAALRVLGDALKIDAKHVPTLLQVARTQLKLKNLKQAEQACRLALKEEPDSAAAYCVLGQIQMEADFIEQARESYETALDLDPDLFEARSFYGTCLKSLGRFDEARRQFEMALKLNPRAYGVYMNFADLETFSPDHPHFKAMREILDEASDPESDRFMGIHFTLGKAYDDIGDHAKAFGHYAIGARLKRARLEYDEARTFEAIDAIREIMNRRFVEDRPFEGNPSPRPVFIVGMPRSGSTLVEQMLASHPKVFGAGEIKTFSRQMATLRARFPALPKYPRLAAQMQKEHYALLAAGYLAEVAKYDSRAERATDKLLSNYHNVGFLHVLFPNAKFLHTKRNPLDTCISAFTKNFKDDLPYSYDLRDLGRYYRKYEELMAHWEDILPAGVMKTVVYERLVEDVEATARELVEFIGLEWDEACLSFHESRRPVKTASVVQVRRPVYASSVGRSERYGAALDPLRQALAEGV